MVWLLELGPYAVALVCLAIAFLITVLVLGFLGWLINLLNKIPTVNIGTGWIHSVGQAVTSGLGKAFHELDGLVGKSFHLGANAFDWLWKEFKGHVVLISLIAQEINLLTHAYAALRSLVHRLEHVGKSVGGAIKTLEREYHGIEHRVKTLEREVGAGIGADVLPRIKTLEREFGHIESQVIPGIEAGIAEGVKALDDFETYVAKNYVSLTRSALAAAVVTALGYLGLSGLNCNSLKNSLGKRACGFWSGLEDLLGLFVDTLLLTNICSLLPILETAVSDVADPLVVALTDVGAGLCSGGIGAAPPLQVPTLSLPANPGFTLSLP